MLQLIGELHDFREALCRDELHLRSLAIAEERLAGACEDGMDRDVEYVEQVLPEERLCEQAVAIDEKISAVLFFELGYLGRDIASQDSRIVPLGSFQRR